MLLITDRADHALAMYDELGFLGRVAALSVRRAEPVIL
jgi:hypothetical protein